MRASISTSSARMTQSMGWAVSALLLPLCIYCFLQKGSYTILDTISQLVHTSGQFVFGYFGALGHAGGGFLLQLLLPVLLMSYFGYYRFCVGIQVFLFWLGQNLIHISYYEVGGREWDFLMKLFSLAPYEIVLNSACFLLGGVCFMITLVLPAFVDED